MREVWRWGINPEEPAYKRTILLSLLGQEDPICAVLQIQSIALVFKYCVVRGLAALAKTNFHDCGTSQDQRGGSTDPFCGGLRSCLPQTSPTQTSHATQRI